MSYVLRRIAGMLVVMFFVVSIVFLIVHIAPGDPAVVMLGPGATAEQVAALRAAWGLDQPLFGQYLLFLRQLAQGDLGQSIFLGQSVLGLLAGRAEPTFFLTIFSTVIACLIAIPLGIYSAYRRNSVWDRLATTLAMFAASVPSFWLGLLLIQTLSLQLGWFPVSGYGGPGAGFLARLYHLFLPAVSLGIYSSALILRFTRASMLDVLGEDYVRTARAKGMGEFRVVMKHALKNALVPIVTIVGMTMALLVAGAVITEMVFGLPGVGNLIVSSVLRRDYPVIQGTLLVVSLIYVLMNFLIDMLYLVIDPRVKY